MKMYIQNKIPGTDSPGDLLHIVRCYDPHGLLPLGYNRCQI